MLSHAWRELCPIKACPAFSRSDGQLANPDDVTHNGAISEGKTLKSPVPNMIVTQSVKSLLRVCRLLRTVLPLLRFTRPMLEHAKGVAECGA